MSDSNIFIPEVKRNILYSPKVHIIILTKDKVDLLSKCLDSITKNTKYANYDIYVADTGSSFISISQMKEKFGNNDKIKLLFGKEYNFGKLNNEIVGEINPGEDDVLVFCNNDVEFLNDCISEMLFALYSFKGIGVVGARLHYPDNRVQHVGVSFTRESCDAYHEHRGQAIKKFFDCDERYDSTESYLHPCPAVTAALMMIRFSDFKSVGCFSNEYRRCFEDIDLCINISLKLGKSCIVAVNAVAYHIESATRKSKPLVYDFYKIKQRIAEYFYEYYIALERKTNEMKDNDTLDKNI